jgi:hypothetical protein
MIDCTMEFGYHDRYVIIEISTRCGRHPINLIDKNCGEKIITIKDPNLTGRKP